MAETHLRRPNIRIEITNNLVESMEVDEIENQLTTEEGEINETEPSTDVQNNTLITHDFGTGNRIWSNTNGGFATGINIFDKQEQEKLQERAKRFALKPEEINNFTDQQLQQLHDSLGITAENEKEIRFEAIHMRGTDEMSTGDVLEYFQKYGPSGIEWIDDSSCNVVWLDRISAARALHFVSKQIKNLPVRGPCNPFIKEFESGEQEEHGSNSPTTGKSVLLRNANREVELQEDGETQDAAENKENTLEDAVDVSEISCPIPPGYWRLGVPHSKAKYILLRFACKTDKKPYKAERFSEYYKKYGNPNYGGLKGIISESHKQKFKGIFDRNREIAQNKPDNSTKNPWGGLAEKWDEDAKFREREHKDSGFPIVVEQTSELKDELKARLGFKRAHESHVQEVPEEEVKEVVEKKSKIPRMRMYADEEEQKIKRKRQLSALKAKAADQSNLKNTDLRNILGTVSLRKNIVSLDTVSNEDMPDLGTKLKNRNWKVNPERIQIVKPNDLAVRGVDRENSRSENRRKRFRSSHSPPHRFERRMHSDRYERRHREPLHYEEEFEGHKPRSKVAVVIKTQKRPTVASAIWSRKEYDRLKTVSEGKLRRYASSSSSESSSSESSSSGSSSESSSSEDDAPKEQTNTVNRPGFSRHMKSTLINIVSDHKSPLRVEINNDHFRKE